MTEPNRFILRATFIERDRLALLSHLEVAATLERTVRRAGLPFAITQGFSPHMKIAFGAALPVGVGSTCEIFDVQLTRYVKPEEALEALQKASVRDLMVQEVHYIDSRAKAASVAYPVSTYRVQFSRAVGELPVPEQIVKTRRKKEKVLNVSEFLVKGFEADENVASCMTFSLEAKPTGSIRADALVNESVAMFNQQLAEGAEPLEVMNITRVAQSEL